jgi:hypothetical protein
LSVKEEIIEKVMIQEDPEKQNLENEIVIEKKEFFGKVKRKYRLMIIFVFFLALILIFMIFPMLIAVFLQSI